MRRRQTDRGADRTPAVPWSSGLAALLLAACVPSPLHAHGFGQRYDLPIPLWLYLLGAGATVGLSFLVVGALMRAHAPGERRWRLALPSGGMLRRAIVLVVRSAAVALFALVAVAGLIGNQSPFKNIAPTMVWVIGWALAAATTPEALKAEFPTDRIFGYAVI